jgi:hypothetical protein
MNVESPGLVFNSWHQAGDRKPSKFIRQARKPERPVICALKSRTDNPRCMTTGLLSGSADRARLDFTGLRFPSPLRPFGLGHDRCS